MKSKQHENLKQDIAAIAANLSDSIFFVWDIDLDEVQVIAGSYESFGISAPSMTYSPSWWMSRIHPQDRPTVMRLVSSVEPGQSKVSCEYRVQRDDGSWADVLDRARVVWREGRVSQFVGVTTDVSVLASTKRELIEARKTAETASATKSRFLANMSHELRTPLNAVTASIALLRNNNISKSESRKLLSVIQRNTNHVLHLVDDILDLAKVEAGMLRIDPKKIHLKSFLTELTEVFQIQANAKELHFSVDITDGVPEAIETDPARLRQILINLTGNALKFTDAGFVRLSVGAKNGQLEFRIRDSGPGIEGTMAAKLFNPFVQLDESLSRKHGGTGLGLNLSMKLASTLGGELTLECSTPGQGSTFLLELPMLAASLNDVEELPNTVSDQRHEPGNTRLSGKTILLVDDAVDNRMLFEKLLELRGAHVLLAGNGLQCVEVVEASRVDGTLPDIVLMDIEMPIMDGPTALRRLRENGFKGPVIAMTAHAMNEHREEYIRLGFDGYVSKPVDQQALVRLICKLVGSGGPLL